MDCIDCIDLAVGLRLGCAVWCYAMQKSNDVKEKS
jgi:hypothetical protein